MTLRTCENCCYYSECIFRYDEEVCFEHLTKKEAEQIKRRNKEFYNNIKKDNYIIEKMYPIKIDKWYIQCETKEFGKVLLLKPNCSLPIAVSFDSEKEAEEYIKQVHDK